MNTKTIIAAVVGAIAAFLFGWLVWGILLMDYFTANTHQYEGMMLAETDMKLWAIFISNLVNAILVAWLFSRMNIKDFMGGMLSGALLFFLISLAMGLMFYALMNWYKSEMIMVIDVIVNTVYGAVIGGIIGWMMGRGENRTAE